MKSNTLVPFILAGANAMVTAKPINRNHKISLPFLTFIDATTAEEIAADTVNATDFEQAKRFVHTWCDYGLLKLPGIPGIYMDLGNVRVGVCNLDYYVDPANPVHCSVDEIERSLEMITSGCLGPSDSSWSWPSNSSEAHTGILNDNIDWHNAYVVKDCTKDHEICGKVEGPCHSPDEPLH
ncbi:hypothetical protein G7054_g8548 [Neopestalotiopsis clavispora]|nr:hypothetical protein G7054_g8548 [Neopestalotiopsis clavispora]